MKKPRKARSSNPTAAAALSLTLAVVVVGVIVVGRIAVAQQRSSLETLAERAAVLARDIELLEDQSAIENLQRVYGFYTDKQMWTQAADLFAASGTIEVGARGVYLGKERVLEYLRLNGPEFPQPGRLFDQMQLQPIVHVAPDGLSAKARWRLFAQEAVSGEYANWGIGIYENAYVKENGIWKISNLHLYTTMYTPYEEGWGKTAIANVGPSAELPPDRPPTAEYEAYPAQYVVPFHYQNPVSGAPVYDQTPADLATATATTADELQRMLTDLDRRVGIVDDMHQLERLNSIYGYYLAHNQWDDFAGIFSATGTIEIAMRGIYIGRAGVRRSMDLYGEAGEKHGLLHNHMQFQPVIDLAPDGQSAKMRSRALSIMGEYETYSTWMGGVYENDYVKEDGVWKIKRDQIFNTYFAPYSVGWKTLAPRPPPGSSATNPPDLPPSQPFEMYPRAFLPPYHYNNPVTGTAVTLPATN